MKSVAPRQLVDIGAGILLGTLVGCAVAINAARWSGSLTPLQPVPAPAAERRAADDGAAHIAAWVHVDDLDGPLALFDTVFWEPQDTVRLRRWIRHSGQVRGKTVLEIGSGSGLLSLCCLQAGARKVVATDINPAAVANTRYNLQRWGGQGRFEVRQVRQDRPEAYAPLGPQERFDLVISNPPWENARPRDIADRALYDPEFVLMDSLLRGLQAHLKPGGKALLAYGCVSAIGTLLELADRYGLQARVLDTRRLDELPEVFLPGMLIEVSPS